MLMSVSNDVEKSIWWLLKKLKQDSLTYVSDTFYVDVTEPEDEYTATQQRKLLQRFVADGIIGCWPRRDQLLSVISTMLEPPENYWKVNQFKVTLKQPAFDEEFEKYRQEYGDVLIRLVKDHVELYVEIDDKQYLLHAFKAGSTPDVLFDYLVLKEPDTELTKKELIEIGALPEKSQPLSTITYKADFTGPLIKYFLPVNDKDKLQLRTQLTLNVRQAEELRKHIQSLPHNSV